MRLPCDDGFGSFDQHLFVDFGPTLIMFFYGMKFKKEFIIFYN